MKAIKAILLFSFMLMISMGSFAQKKSVQTLDAVTVIGTGATYSDSIPTKLADQLNIQIVATQVGGTTEGTGYLLASVDGSSWKNITEKDGLTAFFSNDTLTLTNGAIWNIVIKDNPFKYVKFKYLGGTGDTTSIATSYTIGQR